MAAKPAKIQSPARLLNKRVCDLHLKLRGSWLEAPIRQLRSELKSSGLENMRLRFYLGDEWFSPEGTQSIAIPFWLASPQLQQLEQKFMRQVEGGKYSWCMRLLRHEAGHCFDHCYQVSSLPKWRALFGDPGQPYNPDRYSIDRGTSDFVTNLEFGYGQSHPDEDFAETFAVLLNPKSHWQRRYSNKPKALAKLLYVQSLIQRYGSRRPDVYEASEMCAARKMRQTLRVYYQNRAKVACNLN